MQFSLAEPDECIKNGCPLASGVVERDFQNQTIYAPEWSSSNHPLLRYPALRQTPRKGGATMIGAYGLRRSIISGGCG